MKSPDTKVCNIPVHYTETYFACTGTVDAF